jgi:lantibiotic modifying enzyme
MRVPRLYEAARHEPLRAQAWDPSLAKQAIDEIVDDALGRYDPTRFWPAHPLDEGFRDGSACLYAGASGVIWALDYLEGTGDFREMLPHLIEESRREYRSLRTYPRHASLLMGEVGALLVAMRLRPGKALADELHQRAEDNIALPPLELMWGLPGTMLASVFMAQMTGEARWRDVFRRQAQRLLAELRDTELGRLWIQDLYGERSAYLGPVHGFAGQMLPLLRGWDWLDAAEREHLAAAILRTLVANAWDSEEGVNWHAVASRASPPYLVQYCHGAPGIVITFAEALLDSHEVDNLLRRAGDLIWHAGPLRKGASLCHGTAGNGYAFLKLYRRFGDAQWLERAQAFAMAAIGQCGAARRHYGQGRYSLWTGDLGLAVYLHDCMRTKPRFPTVDVF